MAELVRRCRPLLGTFVEIEADDRNGIEVAFAAIQRVHRLMSAHEPDSDLSRINRFAHLAFVEVDAWTAEVLERAASWSERSEGAFDVVRAGKSAVANGYFPLHSDQPLPAAGEWTCLQIDGRSVRSHKPACADLGGIAKGFAVDRAVDALRGAGCERGMVNAGGDLRCFGLGPWAISIVDPSTRRACVAVGVENGALATSAGLPQPDGGLGFAHLGGAPGGWTSVSVLALTACDADALTKIVCARGAAAERLLVSADATALLISEDGEAETVGADGLVDA